MAALGMLQSKPKESADPNNLKDTWKYLYRSGITARDIDTLSVIHVAGTKGKVFDFKFWTPSPVFLMINYRYLYRVRPAQYASQSYIHLDVKQDFLVLLILYL